MPNNISPYMMSNLVAQSSSDPFLTLVTLNHASFGAPVRLVNNNEDVESRGNTFVAFPMTIRFPAEDGESARDFQIEFDNVSLELIDEIRSVTDPIDVLIELIFASMPDDVQVSQGDLKLYNVTYNAQSIRATILLDNFLNTEMTSEKYNPDNFPGLY